jgi:hypothetical protein
VSHGAFVGDVAAVIRRVSPGRPVTPARWIGHLEPLEDGGLVPPSDADVMQGVMEGVSDPRWEEWKSVTAPATVMFAAKSMFSPGEQAGFVAARPGTRHVLLPDGSHDYLDVTSNSCLGSRKTANCRPGPRVQAIYLLGLTFCGTRLQCNPPLETRDSTA